MRWHNDSSPNSHGGAVTKCRRPQSVWQHSGTAFTVYVRDYRTGDLRRLGERFPERVIVPVPIVDLLDDAPDLVLPQRLAAYGERSRERGRA